MRDRDRDIEKIFAKNVAEIQTTLDGFEYRRVYSRIIFFDMALPKMGREETKRQRLATAQNRRDCETRRVPHVSRDRNSTVLNCTSSRRPEKGIFSVSRP